MSSFSKHPSPPSATSTAQPSLQVRCTLIASWGYLAQTLVFALFTPMRDATAPAMLFPVWAMAVLLQCGLVRGHAHARLGLTALLGAALMPALFDANALVHLPSEVALFYSGADLAVTAGLLVALWLPGMQRWLLESKAARAALSIEGQRKLARRGLLYSTAWVVVSLFSLGCADWFDASPAVTLLTFVPSIATAGALLACFLLRLIHLAGKRA